MPHYWLIVYFTEVWSTISGVFRQQNSLRRPLRNMWNAFPQENVKSYLARKWAIRKLLGETICLLRKLLALYPFHSSIIYTNGILPITLFVCYAYMQHYDNSPKQIKAARCKSKQHIFSATYTDYNSIRAINMSLEYETGTRVKIQEIDCYWDWSIMYLWPTFTTTRSSIHQRNTIKLYIVLRNLKIIVIFVNIANTCMHTCTLQCYHILQHSGVL